MTSFFTSIGMFIFIVQIGSLNSSDFRRTVSKWQDYFESSDFCKTQLNECQNQITTAVNKGRAQSGAKDDIKAAVEMINIYTSNNPQTYLTANAVLRGQTNSRVSKRDEVLFREFARVLEKSINLLCNKYPRLCEKHIVYRGEGYCVSVSGPTYTFKSFLSTSKDVLVAEKFYSRCQHATVLFRMTNVEGIYIRSFSDIPSEEEVLVKPNAKFQITQNLNCTPRNGDNWHDIVAKVVSLGGTTGPAAFIEGTMIGFTSASTELSSPKYVGTALTLIIVYRFMSI